MTDLSALIPIVNMITALATLVGIVLNTRKLNRTASQVEKIEKNTNSLAERAQEGANAIGNLQGRVEQTAERKAEKAP